MTGVEVAVIAGSVITVGDVMLVAGTAMSALGALSSAQAQSNAAKYNAQLAERNATISRQQAAADEERQRRAAFLQQGAARAGYGASGVNVEGSPLDILEQSALQAELDAQTIRWKGEVGAGGYEGEAALNRSRSSSAMTSGYLGAGSAILMGGAKLEERISSRPPAPAKWSESIGNPQGAVDRPWGDK